MEFRPYRTKDREACLELFRSNMPEYFTEEELDQFSSWIDRPLDDLYFVIEDSGQIVACGGIFRDVVRRKAGLAWGMVHRNLHGKGYGKFLTERRLEILQNMYSDYSIGIRTSRHTEAFYQKLGFETVKVTPNGIAPGLDTYEMTLIED